MRSKYKDLSNNTILFTISSIGTKLISFLLVPLYTYVLTTEDYGTADLISTTVSLLLPILSLNVQDAVLRFSLDKEHDPEKVISIASRIVVLGSIILGGVVSILAATGILNIGIEYIIFLWVSYTTNAIYNSLQMYLKAVNRIKTIVIASIASTLVCCGLNITLLLGLKMGITGYLIATALASVTSTAICLFGGKTYKAIHLNYKNHELLKLMLLYSAPLIFNSLAWWINSASDRYILTYFQGTAANGIYSVSYKIPTILSTLQTIFYNAWSVSAIKEFDKDDKDGFIGNIYRLYSCLSFVVCSAIMVLNPYLAKLLYAKDFYIAWKYIPALLIGTVFNGLSLVEGCLFTAVKKTKDVSSSTLIGAGVNTVLNFILIYFIGIQGAAIATMVGYITVWVLRTVKLHKHIINMKVNWFVQITTSLIILVQGVFASIYGTNYIQIIIFAAIVAIQHKEIWGVIRGVLNK